MVITFRSIKKIEFPVYRLPSSNWEITDGLLFVDDKLADDKNMPGRTLGLRRLQTPFDKLLVLRHKLDTLAGIIKQPSPYFIDTLGRPFIYEKTQLCSLKYYKISKIEKKEVNAVLWVNGINFPFTIPRPPESGMLWAGILHFHGLPWILYEYSETKLKDTRRKV